VRRFWESGTAGHSSLQSRGGLKSYDNEYAKPTDRAVAQMAGRRVPARPLPTKAGLSACLQARFPDPVSNYAAKKAKTCLFSFVFREHLDGRTEPWPVNTIKDAGDDPDVDPAALKVIVTVYRGLPAFGCSVSKLGQACPAMVTKARPCRLRTGRTCDQPSAPEA